MNDTFYSSLHCRQWKNLLIAAKKSLHKAEIFQTAEQKEIEPREGLDAMLKNTVDLHKLSNSNERTYWRSVTIRLKWPVKHFWRCEKYLIQLSAFLLFWTWFWVTFAHLSLIGEYWVTMRVYWTFPLIVNLFYTHVKTWIINFILSVSFFHNHRIFQFECEDFFAWPAS